MHFSYDFEDGIEFHETAEEARTRAAFVLDDAMTHAADSGLNEMEHQICWGKVSERAVETERIKAPEDSEFDELINFQLRDPSNANSQPPR